MTPAFGGVEAYANANLLPKFTTSHVQCPVVPSDRGVPVLAVCLNQHCPRWVHPVSGQDLVLVSSPQRLTQAIGTLAPSYLASDLSSYE